MKIEKNIITGIYKYDKDKTYTEGDFVISDARTLYKVKKEVSGLNPLDYYPEYFELYMSPTELATEDDFESYLDNGSETLKDRVVSFDLLIKILDKFCYGISNSGLITNSIKVTDEEISAEIHFSNFFGDVTSSLCSNNPIDYILTAPDLNNVHFIVDSKISSKILGENINVDPKIDSLLHQYTYKMGEDTIRVQELVEPTNGIILYRYTISPDGITFSSSTFGWKGNYLSSKTS